MAKWILERGFIHKDGIDMKFVHAAEIVEALNAGEQAAADLAVEKMIAEGKS